MGSIVYQVQEIWKRSGLDKIGESKHVAKEEARQELKASEQPSNWHTVGKKVGIYSHATADAYRDVWVLAGKFAKAEFGIKNMERQLTGEHIRAFLESKIADDVAHATLLQYSAALEKLEVALNRYCRSGGNRAGVFFRERDSGGQGRGPQDIGSVRGQPGVCRSERSCRRRQGRNVSPGGGHSKGKRLPGEGGQSYQGRSTPGSPGRCQDGADKRLDRGEGKRRQIAPDWNVTQDVCPSENGGVRGKRLSLSRRIIVTN